jgi:hypothetical protein
MAFFLSVPPLVERFGSLSVFAALAVLCSGVFVLLAGVPVSSQAPIVKVNQRSALPNRGAAALSLCAAALLFAGQSSVNSSLVSIGAGVLGGAMLVVTLGGGGAPFVCGAVVLFMGIVFVVPYVYALLAELDEAGRAARQECWLVGR